MKFELAINGKARGEPRMSGSTEYPPVRTEVHEKDQQWRRSSYKTAGMISSAKPRSRRSPDQSPQLEPRPKYRECVGAPRSHAQSVGRQALCPVA